MDECPTNCNLYIHMYVYMPKETSLISKASLESPDKESSSLKKFIASQKVGSLNKKYVNISVFFQAVIF